MTATIRPAGPGTGLEWPSIPRQAWRRGIGVPCPDVGHPRVHQTMVDDGEWAGVPIGGLGTGSIGRTYRGDTARWHLRVGQHRFEPVAADGFALYVGPAGAAGAGGAGAAEGSDRAGQAMVLSALRPTDLPAWGWDLPVGGGTYHALFPRAWQTFEPDGPGLGVRLVGEQLSPVIGGDLERSALPVGVFEWWVENPGPDPLTVGLLFTWADPPAGPDDGAAPGRSHVVRETDDSLGVTFGDPGSTAPTALRGTMAIAARAGEGWALSARAEFDPVHDTGLWADFAADGRLDAAVPAGAETQTVPDATTDAAGAAIAATTVLEPGERRRMRFAIAWDLPMVEFGAGRRWWKRYTREWGRTGARAWDLARHALDDAPAWRAAIETWQAPYLDDVQRPDWYTAALFNELYFLVDGGTFWEAGEVGGPEPARDDIGRFALLECLDYPFYDTVDVDFYASFALLELYPELELRGIRDLLAAVPVDDPHVWTIEASGLATPRKVG